MAFDTKQIARNALDAACASVQKELCVTSGDLAGHFFSGSFEDTILQLLEAYAQAEVHQLLYRDTCYFCRGDWGECKCNWPDGTADSDAPGFEFQHHWVTAPNVSLCGRFYVDPNFYYGEAFKRWFKK